jgi:hypothetical protein
MSNPRFIHGLVVKNSNGGYYHPGTMYDLPKKTEVADIYMEMYWRLYPVKPSRERVAAEARVSPYYAEIVIRELTETGHVVDPEILKQQWNKPRGIGALLSTEEEIFLLSLRLEAPERPNLDYIRQLDQYYGKLVSSNFISMWFKKRFPFRGSFRKPNLIPLDKFKKNNILRFLEYKQKMEILWDHTMWNFLDEKHIVNHDALPKKGRADPLTGYIDFIPVTGDFRQSYNIFAVISGNPTKPRPIEYRIDQENGSSSTFLLFITALIVSGFFKHEEILVMDNARIHTGGEASGVEALLWETPIDGRPLHVLVVYLPTRSPELNPIEFVFHILTARIRSFRYRTAGPCDEVVKQKAKRVFDDMDYALILRIYIHCGY